MDILSTDRIDPLGLDDRVEIAATSGTPDFDGSDLLQPVGSADAEAGYSPDMKRVAAERRRIADLLDVAPDEAWRQIEAGALMPILDPAAQFGLVAI